MPGETHDFDVVKRLEPDAVGVPGARRFRLIVQNNDDTAFLWLEKAYDENSSFMTSLKFWSVFDGLRSDPRFVELLGRVGLPQ